MCARCSRGADDVRAPIGHIPGKDFVAAGYSFKLVVFGRDGNTAVLLDERARGTRASRDIPAEIGCGAYEVVPAAYGGGCEGKLLRIAVEQADWIRAVKVAEPPVSMQKGAR